MCLHLYVIGCFVLRWAFRGRAMSFLWWGRCWLGWGWSQQPSDHRWQRVMAAMAKISHGLPGKIMDKMEIIWIFYGIIYGQHVIGWKRWTDNEKYDLAMDCHGNYIFMDCNEIYVHQRYLGVTLMEKHDEKYVPVFETYLRDLFCLSDSFWFAKSEKSRWVTTWVTLLVWVQTCLAPSQRAPVLRWSSLLRPWSTPTTHSLLPAGTKLDVFKQRSRCF